MTKPKTSIALLASAESIRLEVQNSQDSATKKSFAQYLSPHAVAAFMASLFERIEGDVVLLDPGAGTGILTAAFAGEILNRGSKATGLEIHTFEIDEAMARPLRSTLDLTEAALRAAGMVTQSEVHARDFILETCDASSKAPTLYSSNLPKYTHCIMNPPYKKIRSESLHRRAVREFGLETSNLYSAFLSLSLGQMQDGGELVAIVPRSFCNGRYFKDFRRFILRHSSIIQIHVFESRSTAFRGDDVLQENVIVHLVKGPQTDSVVISTSRDSSLDDLAKRELPFGTVVRPDDPELFIRIPASALDDEIAKRIERLPSCLANLGLAVKTGPVVDFRMKENLRFGECGGAVPLIYPGNLVSGRVMWPLELPRKAQWIFASDRSKRSLMVSDWLVLVKRFSAKEEKRRIVAAVFEPSKCSHDMIGFENHLNVFYGKTAKMDEQLAWGLATFLNSTLVDLYFRQFSGHTQVNATDLRSLPFPNEGTLRSIGARIDRLRYDQQSIDALVNEVI